MKRSRFLEEEIIGILKEHQAGVSAVDLCRKQGTRSEPVLHSFHVLSNRVSADGVLIAEDSGHTHI